MTHDSEAFLEKALSAAFSPEGPEEAASAAKASDAPPRRSKERVPDAVGRFRVLGVVGRGGSGVVLRAFDDVLDREVAVKLIHERFADDPEMIRRFVGEGRTGGRLQHPGVVPVHEAGVAADGRPFLVMKLVEGETLAARLASRPTVGAERLAFLSVFEKICQITAYAHARGETHLDLKPSNVLIGAYGEVLVLDWGFGRDGVEPAVDDQGRRARVVGTPSYMAPEQAKGDRPRIGPRSDVFALGSMLCELLTGAPAYDAGTAAEAYLAASRVWLDDASARLAACDAPDDLKALAARCLAPDPASRPADADEVAREIDRHLRTLDARAREAIAEAAAARAGAEEAVRRRRLVAGAAAIVVVAAAVACAAWLSFESERAARRSDAERAATTALGHARSAIERARASGPAAVDVWDDAVETARRQAAVAESADVPSDLLAPLLSTRAEAEAGRSEAEKDARILDGVHAAHERSEQLRDPRATDREYAALFAEAGVDVAAPDAAALLATHRLRDALFSALDEWIVVRRSMAGKAGAASLISIAEAAESDPWRRELRAAWFADDVETATRLAATPGRRERPTSSLLLLSRALRRNGRADEGLSVLRDAVADRPNDYDLRHEMAVALRAVEDTSDEAFAHATAALALKPKSAHARTDLAHVLLARDALDEAERFLTEALRIRPDDAVAFDYLGAIAWRRGDGRKAESLLRRALEIDPTSPLTRSKYGIVLARLGRTDEAVATLRRAAEEAPSRPEYRFHLARALLDAGEEAEAAAIFKEWLSDSVGRAADWYDFGRAIAVVDAAGAATAFEEAIKRDGAFAEAWCNLGFALVTQGRLAEGARALEKGDALGAGRPGWTYPSAAWLAEVRTIIETERVLSTLEPEGVDEFVQELDGGDVERCVVTSFIAGRSELATAIVDAVEGDALGEIRVSPLARFVSGLARIRGGGASAEAALKRVDTVLDEIAAAPATARPTFANNLRRHFAASKGRTPEFLAALDPNVRADLERRFLRLDLLALGKPAHSPESRAAR